MVNVPELFGSMVFNEKVMKERLPKNIFESLQKTIKSNNPISIEVANVVAEVMKDWAIEKGATHFTHWFQPMNGITAEKHEGFIQPAEGCACLMNFSGKSLIKGEPDASSFPNGGLRSIFEARGYTAWDPTSYAFVKDTVLYIPTAFISYSGQVLDKKTPLLRSMECINAASKRVLKLFGKTPERVTPSVGAEQEYFLIPVELFNKRPDLVITGRTLFGAKPPKGQELEDHYFGNVKPRVLKFMEDVDIELWKLGIFSKTRHNEVAPSQHELTPVYSMVNITTDHNQLMMSVMQKVAERHGLVCLLHEKPFEGVNGSGKHNNWSLTTSDGENLLEPGKDLKNNLQFMLFLMAAIKAVDKHQDLLRISIATAGNDHRLGAHEAPPAIISIYLGDELTDLFETISSGNEYSNRLCGKLSTGVESVPEIMEDTADRNRTSPFAFTGNKFEFRSLGSSLNIACPNIMINTAVSEVLNEFAERLEKADNFEEALKGLIKNEYVNHKRIVFNGNNYSDEWVKEAKSRGLLNLKSTPESLAYFDRNENIELFEKLKIYTREEVLARKAILLENYSNVINIEALTMCEMVQKQILPAAIEFSSELAQNIKLINDIKGDWNTDAQNLMLKNVSETISNIYGLKKGLLDAQAKIKEQKSPQSSANYCHDKVLRVMRELRYQCDELEKIMPKNLWPFPTYTDILYYV